MENNVHVIFSHDIRAIFNSGSRSGDRQNRYHRPKERRQSSSSNNSVILIDDRSSSKERSRKSSGPTGKAEKRIYQPPIKVQHKNHGPINPQKLDALSRKTTDIKANLSDILGMLDKK